MKRVQGELRLTSFVCRFAENPIILNIPRICFFLWRASWVNFGYLQNTVRICCFCEESPGLTSIVCTLHWEIFRIPSENHRNFDFNQGFGESMLNVDQERRMLASLSHSVASYTIFLQWRASWDNFAVCRMHWKFVSLYELPFVCRIHWEFVPYVKSVLG